jgi:hypothetical protein
VRTLQTNAACAGRIDEPRRRRASNGARLVQEGFSLQDLGAAVVTHSTRSFKASHRGRYDTAMVPVLELANHANNCSTT